MSSVWKAELILIITTPYLVFWTADVAFGISGALATMVFGLWMSSHRTCISPDVEELVNRIWEIISLVSNTLIFSIVGVLIIKQVVGDDGSTIVATITAADWIDLIMINVFLIIIRLVTLAILSSHLFIDQVRYAVVFLSTVLLASF